MSEGIEMKIERYFQINGCFPGTLAEVGMEDALAPRDNPYRYMRLQAPPTAGDESVASAAAGAAGSNSGAGAAGAAGGASGQARKDHQLVPVNTGFDLFSMGPDGRPAPALTASMSRGDIERANNGRYTGEASGD